MAPVDLDKVRSHLDYICGRIRILSEIEEEGRDAFLEDEIVQGASIRYLHTAVEAMIDIANHVVARRGLGLPDTYREVIDMLIDEGVLPEDRRETFHEMVRFRNRAVHLYDPIDAEEVYEILANHLGDFEVFVSSIVEAFFEGSE